MTINPTAPIGIFDSGVGGLTVVKEVGRLLPNENIIYFGDTARVPYGSKSAATIIHFSEQITRFLLTKQVKAIVIACNTASALALDKIREQFSVPIMGVVLPGAKTAIESTKNNKIGIIGTDATVNSQVYSTLIHSLNPDAQVLAKACPLFVPLVEEGLQKHLIAQEAIGYYLASMKASEIDTMILGCTHYPLLRKAIANYLGEQINIVNPAFETAADVKKILQANDLLNDKIDRLGHYEFYVSDGAKKFRQFANTVMPFEVPKTNVINIEEY